MTGFDPIEAGLRERVREIIEEMIRSELDAVLSSPRYGRRRKEVAGQRNRRIPWIDGQKHQRPYVPDFWSNTKVVEKSHWVKDPSRRDSPDVLRKRKSAEIWCEHRHMEYMVATIG
jgi:hypothetical protein